MKEEKSLIGVLNGEKRNPPPVWLMRQAGRYLPEYRELRARAGSFWAMCNDPVLATEITLQPIRRFGFDAAIIFSDILTIPFALGCDVKFTEGEGPSLPPITTTDGLEHDLKVWHQKLTPAYETLRSVRTRLDSRTSLLGFAGAPWTLATYMAAGRGGDEQRAAKLWGYREPESFEVLLNVLADCVAWHLINQLEAGADAVQIFDSWASGLPGVQFNRWVIAPTKKIVAKIRTVHPKAKIIGFPRAATLAGYERYANETGVNAVSLDTAAPMSWAAKTLGDKVALQGNLDPLALIAGGRALHEGVETIRKSTRDIPFIFNLGHGILPETPIAHVEELLKLIRSTA